MDRRKFLNTSFSALLSSSFLFFPGQAKASYGDIIVGGGMYKNLDTNKIQFLLGYVDLGSYTIKQIPLSFLPHGIALDPNNHNRIFAFEKIGPGACVINLEYFFVEKYLKSLEGNHFYGHGMPNKEGTLTFYTETNIITNKGFIPIRDTKTLQVVDRFPTYGEKPHDCHLIENGNIMAITNAGGSIENLIEQPSVTFVDIKTRKLLEKIQLHKILFCIVCL